MKRHAAVVGCGPAGASAALFLHRLGFEVEVFEKSPELGPVGAGVLLQPSGMLVAERLGVLRRLLALGKRVKVLRGRTRSGRLILELDYRRFAPEAFSLGIHRGALFQVLREALEAEGVAVRAGQEIVSARHLGGRSAMLENSRGKRFGPFDLLAVADGARSRLRGASPLRQASRRYPWGALWTTAPDPGGEFARREELVQVYQGTRKMFGAKPSGFLPGREGEEPLATLFWSLPASDFGEWRARGLDAWKSEVLAHAPMAAPFLERIGDIGQVVASDYQEVWMRRWNEGCAAYLGDAAHATSPQMGQGVNLGMWDAMVLADCLRARRDIPEALDLYTRRRWRHVRFYQRAAKVLTPFFQSGMDFLAWPRDLALGTLCRLPWTRAEGARVAAGVKDGLFSRLRLEDHGRPEAIFGAWND